MELSARPLEMYPNISHLKKKKKIVANSGTILLYIYLLHCVLFFILFLFFYLISVLFLIMLICTVNFNQKPY